MLNSHFYYERDLLGTIVKIEPVSFSVQLVLQEAEKLGIKWSNVPGTFFFDLDYNGKKATFYDRTPPNTSHMGVLCCKQKQLTKHFLQKKGIATPQGFFIKKNDAHEYIEKVFNLLKKPIVVKPSDGSHGDGITLNITDYDTYRTALEKAWNLKNDPEIGAIVEEEFVGGKEYRILVTREKVLAVLHRIPANIVGDGEKNILQLIEEKNNHPFRNLFDDPTYQVYGKLSLDDEALKLLQENNVNPKTVLEKNRQVFIRRVSNMMAGGDAIDLTDEVHESVKKICLDTIKSIPGLALCGIDFMTTDLYSEQYPGTYTIVELNHNAEFGIHHFPMQGKIRNTALEFLKLIFPEIGN